MTIIKPFDFQKEAIQNTLDLIKTKEMSWLLEMATWTWKTITSAFIIKEYEKEYWRAKHIFIVPKNSILTNIIRDYTKVFPDKKIWVWNSANKDEDWDILLTTYHSLTTQRVFEKFGDIHFWIIIFDEAHLSDNVSCERIKDIYSYSFILNQTATPFIQSKTETFLQKMAWWNLIYKLWIFEAIRSWYLSKPKYKVLLDSQDWKTIDDILANSWTSEYSKRLTQDYVVSESRNKFILDRLKSDWTLNAHKNYLVYCMTIRHLKSVVAHWLKEWELTEDNYTIITWNTSQEKREDYFKRFEEWKLKYIFSIRTLTEWVDIKWAESIINLAPTKSKVLFFQKLWRVIRKEEWKEFWYIYDFVFDITQKRRIQDRLMEKLVLEKLVDKKKSTKSDEEKEKEKDKNEFDKLMEQMNEIWFEIEFDEEIFEIEEKLNKVFSKDEMKQTYIQVIGNNPVTKMYFDKYYWIWFTSRDVLKAFETWDHYLDFVWVVWIVDKEKNEQFNDMTKEEIIEVMKKLSKDKFWWMSFWILEYNKLSNKPFETKKLISVFKSWNKLLQELWLERVIWAKLIDKSRFVDMYKAIVWDKILSIQQYAKLDKKPLSLKAIQNIFWTWEEFIKELENNI